MVDKIPGFLDKRKNAKLYRQWVEREGLPSEEIPAELQGRREGLDESGLPFEDVSQEALYRGKRQRETDRGLVVLPLRHILLAAGVAALLLVTVAVLSTILVMKPC